MRTKAHRHARRTTPGPLFAALLLLPAAARPASLHYSVNHVGGATWEYVYTVAHDGTPAGAPLEQFAVGFDPALYRESSLTVVTPAPLSNAWDERLLASGPDLDAFYDVQAMGGGLSPGQQAGGFRVRFEWLGSGVPGAQPLWVFTPGDPTPVQEGSSSTDAPSIPTGGPVALALLAAALAALALGRLRRNPQT